MTSKNMIKNAEELGAPSEVLFDSNYLDDANVDTDLAKYWQKLQILRVSEEALSKFAKIIGGPESRNLKKNFEMRYSRKLIVQNMLQNNVIKTNDWAEAVTYIEKCFNGLNPTNAPSIGQLIEQLNSQRLEADKAITIESIMHMIRFAKDNGFDGIERGYNILRFQIAVDDSSTIYSSASNLAMVPINAPNKLLLCLKDGIYVVFTDNTKIVIFVRFLRSFVRSFPSLKILRTMFLMITPPIIIYLLKKMLKTPNGTLQNDEFSMAEFIQRVVAYILRKVRKMFLNFFEMFLKGLYIIGFSKNILILKSNSKIND